MKIKKINIYHLLIEQWGRISIAGVGMWGVITIGIEEPAKFFSMISIILWMLLPTLKMFKFAKDELGEEQ